MKQKFLTQCYVCVLNNRSSSGSVFEVMIHTNDTSHNNMCNWDKKSLEVEVTGSACIAELSCTHSYTKYCTAVGGY